MKPESLQAARMGKIAKRKAKMPYLPARSRCFPGVWGPAPGSRALAFLVSASTLFAAGCGEKEETRILDPVQVAMDENVPASYMDDEMTLYEVKRGVQFPIIAPRDDAMANLQNTPVEPYGRKPWVTIDD